MFHHLPAFLLAFHLGTPLPGPGPACAPGVPPANQSGLEPDCPGLLQVHCFLFMYFLIVFSTFSLHHRLVVGSMHACNPNATTLARLPDRMPACPLACPSSIYFHHQHRSTTQAVTEALALLGLGVLKFILDLRATARMIQTGCCTTKECA